jgi:3-deoxy-manno-octulosonate cytidylyltransferase (CMP-KDO synthetase)
MKTIGIIPARYASSRFPGKPLVDIRGKSMIQRVYEQAMKAQKLSKVIVATDDKRIYDHVKSFGGNVEMTSSTHESGTDRISEVMDSEMFNGWNVAINIQGDEPFIDPSQIDALAGCFDNGDVQIATLAIPLKSEQELFSENVPKVVISRFGEALYFSRHPLPFFRGLDKDKWVTTHQYYKHIGIYAFRTGVLRKLTEMERSPLEIAESLEQLRWMENGYRIKVQLTEHESFSVDVPEDLEKLSKLFPQG